jgi:phage baseplate assembly protein W
MGISSLRIQPCPGKCRGIGVRELLDQCLEISLTSGLVAELNQTIADFEKRIGMVR